MALVVAVGYLGAMGYAMSHTSYNVWGAFIVGPVLLAVSIPMMRAATRRETEPAAAEGCSTGPSR